MMEPEKILKERYKTLNYVLITIIGIYIIFRVFSIFQSYIQYGLSYDFLLIGGIDTFMLILILWAFISLFHFNPIAYLFIAILSVLSITPALRTLSFSLMSTAYGSPILNGINVLFTIVTSVLPLFLKKKLFPNISLIAVSPKKKK